MKRRVKGERKVTVAVDHVDLKVKSGEFFGILGPNGAGKTTLIKLLTCLLYPDEGTAIVNGYDIRKDRKMVKASSSLICGCR
ncbi:MAG: ATP-binding cassette domain-containing protein, partial [Candidatus Bathyarchaeota archaeon]|nr:ATP-binding cassette domain-containing protein [Candidatus Bathyarchaeota archaeon]